MEIGVVGKPNVGKSTFFGAVTLAQAERANYPFTTIDANKGVGYVRNECPHLELGKDCEPNNSHCIHGTRYVPVELIDVAGLVPDAHKGKGLGNKFLDDLRMASALVHIVDVSGSTDEEGNPVKVGNYDPMQDVKFLESEITHWIIGILDKNWRRLTKRIENEGKKIDAALTEQLSGLGIDEHGIAAAIRKAEISGDRDQPSKWGQKDIFSLADTIRAMCKPMIIAANKADIASEENIEAMKLLDEYLVIETAADYEYALRKAAEAGLISYTPGDGSFDIINDKDLKEGQRKALGQIADYLEKHPETGTGVQKVLEHAVYQMLDMIVAYPVEDETHWTDKDGNVLPDAFLVPRGSTAKELAYKVHTDLGDGFIRAIDGRTHRTIGADHEIKNRDVIKIVAKT